MVKTYDPACYDLAEHFMQDEPFCRDKKLYEKNVDDLAKCIQKTVEDWFAFDINELEKLGAAAILEGMQRK